MNKNEAAEQLRDDLVYVTEPATERYLSLLDEALATERRLTVEPYLHEVQRLCRNCTSPELAGTQNGYSCGRHRRLYLSAIQSEALDDLATADAKEEGK